MLHLQLLMHKHFPFLSEEDIDSILSLCRRNNGLVIYPEEKPNVLLGYFRFFPELILAVEQQDFELLNKCDLTHGPLAYIAALILPYGHGYGEMRHIAKVLNSRAYAFHRYKRGQWRFHFFKNSLCSERVQNASVH